MVLPKNSRIAALLTGSALVLLTAVRVGIAPQLTADATLMPAIVLILLCIAALAAIMVITALHPNQPCVAEGKPVTLLSAACVLVGTAMILNGVLDLGDWLFNHRMPYPSKALITVTDMLGLYLQVVTAIIGGVFFIRLAWRWLELRKTERGQMPLMALTPLLWMWMRVIRYEMSYASSAGLFRNVYDLGMILFEMVFFLLLARYVSGEEEKPSRYLFGVSLATGFLCAMGCITRLSLYIGQQAEAFSDCGLVVAPDAAVALLAFVFAFTVVSGQKNRFSGVPFLVSDGYNTEDEEEPENDNLLLNSEFGNFEEMAEQFNQETDEDENDAVFVPADGKRRPMDIDDVINQIINGQ